MERVSRLIAILYAVPQELEPMRRRLGAVRISEKGKDKVAAHRAFCGTSEVLLVAGGMGRRKALEAADWIIGRRKPDLLIIAGVAGALSPSLRIGDLVIADAILGGDEGAVEPAPLPLMPGEEMQKRLRIRTGPLLSLDRVLVTAAEKRSAYAHTAYHPHPPPLAVEMETAGVARMADSRGVAWAAIRAISDTASESLPLDFNKLRDKDGDLPQSKVATAAMMNPGAIGGLMRLGGNTNSASEALARFLDEWMRGLG